MGARAAVFEKARFFALQVTLSSYNRKRMLAVARFVIQVCGWAVGLPLEVLAISALLRNGYRRYPLVFLYLLVNFVTTLVDIPMGTQSFFFPDAVNKSHTAKLYWINEGILQVLIFATVLSLIDLAISMSRWRRVMRVALAGGAFLFAAITFLIQYRPDPNIGVWMTPWTRDLSVCTTILDLALWMILIASRKSDRRLLLISGALGMQFTAEAIGEAVVNLSVPHRSLTLALIGSVVAVAGNLICLYIWWQTFRTERKPLPARR